MGSGHEIKDGELVLRFNPSVYSLDRIYATAYIFLDKYYFVFDGEKDKEIILKAKPKKKDTDLESFSKAFFEELHSQTNYFNLLEKNRDIITLIIQRALFSLEPDPLNAQAEQVLEQLLQEKDIIQDGKNNS